MKIIHKYFPDLTDVQTKQFESLEALYREWNEKINVLSRKDIDHLYERHVLHSLAIARFCQFHDKTQILDVGTGGGFPGIPLAILFPTSDFTLVDSIGKKILVVKEIAQAIGLENVSAHHLRAEKVNNRFHFVVSRAVTALPKFIPWVRKSFHPRAIGPRQNGMILLKGGDLSPEINGLKKRIEIVQLSDYFDEVFFETKKILYLAAD